MGAALKKQNKTKQKTLAVALKSTFIHINAQIFFHYKFCCFSTIDIDLLHLMLSALSLLIQII